MENVTITLSKTDIEIIIVTLDGYCDILSALKSNENTQDAIRRVRDKVNEALKEEST